MSSMLTTPHHIHAGGSDLGRGKPVHDHIFCRFCGCNDVTVLNYHETPEQRTLFSYCQCQRCKTTWQEDHNQTIKHSLGGPVLTLEENDQPSPEENETINTIDPEDYIEVESQEFLY